MLLADDDLPDWITYRVVPGTGDIEVKILMTTTFLQGPFSTAEKIGDEILKILRQLQDRILYAPR